MVDLPSDLRHAYAELSGARLHYVEAGSGPLVILLHGFPEFWLSWRFQIPALVAAGYRVVAPDMRGYNLSSRPQDVSDYHISKLSDDVRELIAERGESRALLVGHDWGAAVAWFTAMNHPEVIERLAILNLPHPRKLLAGMSNPLQLMRSWYVFFFQLPWLPERAFRALLRPLYFALERDARPGAFSGQDLSSYLLAWSQPGAARGMINYYRAALSESPSTVIARLRPIHTPTLVIWGERDRYLQKELAEPLASDVPGLRRVVRLPEATHWVHQDEPERVSQLLIDFFRDT
jgi:epoxide hydrolase 4